MKIVLSAILDLENLPWLEPYLATTPSPSFIWIPSNFNPAG